MSKPTIVYFPVRGRAEAMKLALAAAGVEFNVDHNVTLAGMKADREHYPFGQCPRFVDGDIDIVQSNTILRYIARKYNLLGNDEKEITKVDMVMEGVESLRAKYVNLIYIDQLSDSAKSSFFSAHLDKESASGRNGGAHVAYLSALLAANSGGSGFVAGSGLTIADICMFDMVDLLNRIFPEQMKAMYPDLLAHHAKVAEVPGIKAYLASPLRVAKINGNDLG